MAGTLSTVVDSFTAQHNFVHDAMDIQDQRIASLDQGVDLATRIGNQCSNETQENRDRIMKLELANKDMLLELAEASRKAKAALTAAQQIQLERSQNVVIVRGIRPEKNEENYEDLERAFFRMLRKLKLDGGQIKINYLRRLPRNRGERTGEPLSVRVELSSLGDKIKMFNRVEEMVKSKEENFEYSITNEIPRYALNSYKYLCRIATEVRHQNAALKTRVGIMRGDSYPVITIRKRTEKDYKKIDEPTMERAKAEVVRKNKLDSDRRKREREEAMLLGPQPMEQGGQAGK